MSLANPLQTNVSPRESLKQSIDAYQFSQCLYVAAKLGIADLLKDGPKHYEELAKASGAIPNALFRLLRALASAGVFNQFPGDQFGLNEVSEYLCTDVPGSLRAYTILAGEQPYPAWGQLLHSIQTGETAFDHLFGMNVWQYRQQNPSAADVFNKAMSDSTRATTSAIVQAYDFSRFDCVVDVGGGQGALLAGILKDNPSVHGVLFDLEPVVQGAQETIKNAGISERYEIIGGSILEGIPAGGDAYILKNILNDWDDGDVTRILSNCRQVMKEEQTLLIIEQIIPSSKPTLDVTMGDLRMMVQNGGRLRTREEYQPLLRRAGFELTKVIPIGGPYQILEGKAVQ